MLAVAAIADDLWVLSHGDTTGSVALSAAAHAATVN
jgi:hypothetical protein